MSRDRERNTMVAMLGSLGWPLILGLSTCAIFYAAVHQGFFGSELVRRYFATHPVSYAATAMFFVGLCALALKLVNLVGQFLVMPALNLEIPGGEALPLEQAGQMLDRMEELPATARRSYLGQRLQDALDHVERHGSAEDLDDELKYLADMDAGRQHDSYALVRIIIWATPMLGFLGTVIGITQALGDLDPTVLATDIQTAMSGLLAGLYVAFDTTALALSLSIALMFVQFLVDRVETQLLALVDGRVVEQLEGMFEPSGATKDPYLNSVQRMSREAIQASERLVQQQVEIWQQSLDMAQRRWTAATEGVTEPLRDVLSETLDQVLGRFAERLSQTQREAEDEAVRRWEQWQTSLSHNARLLHAQQQEMVKHGEILARVVEATGEVTQLEAALNQNLQLLAGAKNFEDTVMSLAAAIHLLNTRLNGGEATSSRVDLGQKTSRGRAA